MHCIVTLGQPDALSQHPSLNDAMTSVLWTKKTCCTKMLYQVQRVEEGARHPTSSSSGLLLYFSSRHVSARLHSAAAVMDI
eukprot:8398-Heterococcus_DN1.PRE.8